MYISKKSSTFAPDLEIVLITTIKKFTIMTTKEYYEEKLSVKFTMQELYAIASALATESFTEREAGRLQNEESAWELRKKVCKYIQNYNEIYN